MPLTILLIKNEEKWVVGAQVIALFWMTSQIEHQFIILKLITPTRFNNVIAQTFPW